MIKVGPGFEWFVAWRHLRDPERQSHRTLIVGLAILALGVAACFAAVRLCPRRVEARPGVVPRARRRSTSSTCRSAAWSPSSSGVLVTYLGILLATFTVFTAISIFGVFLGTAAPIIALSVMSGFEADLKGKIRGTKADVVIDAQRRPTLRRLAQASAPPSPASRASSLRPPTSRAR